MFFIITSKNIHNVIGNFGNFQGTFLEPFSVVEHCVSIIKRHGFEQGNAHADKKNYTLHCTVCYLPFSVNVKINVKTDSHCFILNQFYFKRT